MSACLSDTQREGTFTCGNMKHLNWSPGFHMTYATAHLCRQEMQDFDRHFLRFRFANLLSSSPALGNGPKYSITDMITFFSGPKNDSLIRGNLHSMYTTVHVSAMVGLAFRSFSSSSSSFYASTGEQEFFFFFALIVFSPALRLPEKVTSRAVCRKYKRMLGERNDRISEGHGTHGSCGVTTSAAGHSSGRR